MSDGDDYQVGYGKPPRHTRFKKGQSGNPAGKSRKRRAAEREFSAAIAKALEKRFQLPESHGGKRVTKIELLADILVNGALSKNLGMAKLVIGQLEQAEQIRKAAPDERLNENESAIFDDLVRRLREGDDDAEGDE